MIICDLCKQEQKEFYLNDKAPDILLCYRCNQLSAAQVVRHYLAASWPRCPKTGLACRSAACTSCRDHNS